MRRKGIVMMLQSSIFVFIFWSFVSVLDKRVIRLDVAAAATTVEPSSLSGSTSTTNFGIKRKLLALKASTVAPSRRVNRKQQFLSFISSHAWRGGGGGSYLEHEEDDDEDDDNVVEDSWIEEDAKGKYYETPTMASIKDENMDGSTLGPRSAVTRREDGYTGEGQDLLDVDEEELVHILEEEDKEESSLEPAVTRRGDGYTGEEQDLLDVDEEELVHILEEEAKEESALSGKSFVSENNNVGEPDRASSQTKIRVEESSISEPPIRRTATKRRKTFDMNVDLITRSGVDGDAESQALRQLIMQRRDEHLRHLLPSTSTSQHQDKDEYDDAQGKENDVDWDQRLHQYHPKRLLRFLAPKIPAIKHSRDAALRIQSARSDVDAGVAACLISTLAHVCEVYSNTAASVAAATDSDTTSSSKKKQAQSASSVAWDLIQDRRFEQLVECILCGVDVRRRKREYLIVQLHEKRQTRKENNDLDVEEPAVDDETRLLIEEEVTMDEGLSIRDACRAAWGIAILGVYKTPTMSDTKVSDILLALSLRIRELLLARIQALRQDDFLDENQENSADPNVDLTKTSTTIEERIMIVAEEIAEDAATAMWTFACVRAVCGDIMTAADGSSFTTPLMKVCSSILCHDPLQLRRQAQEEVVLDQSVGEDSEMALLSRHRATGRLCRNTQKEIGSNDVVERLARAEAAETESERSGDQDAAATNALENQPIVERLENKMEEDGSPKDALLDWLSPSEITDVMWSLATHGNRDGFATPASREEPSLSEAASALCFIAFDRLLAYVQQDLKTVQEAAKTLRKREMLESAKSVCEEKGESMETVHLVQVDDTLTKGDDASSLSSDEENLPVVVESMTIKNAEEGTIGVHVEEVVHVVDAASLLASEAQQTGVAGNGGGLDNGPPSPPPLLLPKDDEMTESLTITSSKQNSGGEQVVQVVDAASLLASEAEQGNGATKSVDQVVVVDTDEEEIDTTDEEVVLNIADLQDQLLFSMHDLCAMTWAATELHDSLRCTITAIVSHIIAELGKHSLEGCTGSDLSNLCWAVAKCSTEGTHAPTSEGKVVASWIAEHVYNEGSSMGDDVAERAQYIQMEFQPPQLSRLLWSISSALSDNRDRSINLDVPGKLALAALLAAENSLHLYGTEDLVRIAWAFLELNDLNIVRCEHPGAITVLGRVMASIDLSLADWEACKPPTPKAELEDGTKEPIRFMSFFGKSRNHAAALQQELEKFLDDSNAEDFHGATFEKERRIPLLKNLPVDPATLCKLVHSCSRISTKTQVIGIRGCEKLGRVALRLMTSRNGRLLRECHAHDLARICEAATLMVSTTSRELVSLFARRVVAILNDSPDLLVRAPSHVHADLLLSLGDLGVKHNPNPTAPFPHRRLQLTIVDPFVKAETLCQLPDSVYLSLLKGLMSLNVISTDSDYLIVVLKGAIARLPSLIQETSVCDLAETLGTLYEEAKALNVESASNSTSSRNESTEDEETLADTSSTVFSLSRELLSQVADGMVERVGNISTDDLRRLLTVYAMLPFQADELVDAIEAEVKRRSEHALTTPRPETERSNLEDVLLNAASNAAFLKRSLIGEEEEESRNHATPFEALRKGLQSIFHRPTRNSNNSERGDDDLDGETTTDKVSSHDDEGTPSVESEEYLDEHEAQLLVEIEEALHSVTEAVSIARHLAPSIGSTSDTKIEQELFELGRCDELIAHYRHFDFHSGTHKSRFDNEGRRDMAKRVLSRLLP